jgi:hypothetical protein
MSKSLALEVASPKMLQVLLDYSRRAGLQWDVDSPYISKWKSESWFSRLTLALESSNISEMNVDGMIHISAARSDEMRFTEKEHNDVVYLEVKVPTSMTSVHRLHFRTESHDQGRSNSSPCLKFAPTD